MKRMVLAFAVGLLASQVSAMQSLSDLEWKNRVILVFGSSADPRLDQQIGLLGGHEDELADRDLVIIKVSDDEAVSVYGSASRLNAAALRKDANLADDRFQVLLVGKDGGVKFSSDRVVSNIEFFDLIDRMPMRRAEHE